MSVLLDEAKTAYHNLVTGKSVEEMVDENNRKVRYTPANIDKLAAYIARLESQETPTAINRMHPVRLRMNCRWH